MPTRDQPGRSAIRVPTRPSILIVDDQPMTLSALRRMFVREGYEVHTASDGPGALELLGHIECDLLMTDYLMPRMDGIELLRRVRARWPRLACIMLTGRADLDVAAEAVRSELLCKFALKPWHGADLKASVAAAIASRRMPAASGATLRV